MKIYGNSASDGFTTFVSIVGATFVVGGVLLNTIGGTAILIALPVMIVLVARMISRSDQWDVLSDAPVASGVDHGVPVRMPNFPVKADTDVKAIVPAVVVGGWVPSKDQLPSIDKPKHAVETNTHVV